MTTSADKVLQYLEEIHALELSLGSTLSAHIAMTPRSEYRDLLERHRYETRTQAQRIERRMAELGRTNSLLHLIYGTAQTVVGQGVALALGPVSLLRGTGGEEKLLKNAKDEAASEALEIASYDALEAVASVVGDEKTAVLAREHRTQEELFLKELRKQIPGLAGAVIEAEVEGHPTYDPATTGAVDAARDVAKKAKGTAKRAQKKAQTTAGQASAAADAVVADLGEAAADITSAADGVAEGIEDAAEGVRGEIKQATRRVRGEVEHAADGVVENVREAADEVTGEARGATAEIPQDLPIDNYDALRVEQVLPKLKTLSAEELAAIDGHERGEKARKRVLDRIAALRTKAVDAELAKL